MTDKFIAATYRVNHVAQMLSAIIEDVQKAVAKTLENQDFEYLITWKSVEMTQSNTARHLLRKIGDVRELSKEAGKTDEEADRNVVAMLIAESWKLANGTGIYNSTSSASNLVNEAKIELGRKLMGYLGMDSYYLNERVAKALLDDVAPLSK